LLNRLGHASPPIDTPEEIASLRETLQASKVETDSLASLERTRARLRGISASWQSLPATAAQWSKRRRRT
jgi:hypothetical protein